MDKYTLLIVLNLPFVALGLLKALIMYRKGSLSRLGFVVRAVLWVVIVLGLFFARDLYGFLYSRGLTDSQPLSIADVVLVTGVVFCLFTCLRLYSKIELIERRFNDLHEKLSITLSAESPKEHPQSKTPRRLN